MTALQEMFSEFGCTVLNYSNVKILVSYFFNEEMYNKFLEGIDCVQGQGIRDVKEELDFSRLPTGALVVVQREGAEITRYQYLTLLKATIDFKDKISGKKRGLTFQIRKQRYGPGYNLLLTSGESNNFDSLRKVKQHLSSEFGNYRITDWELPYETDDAS